MVRREAARALASERLTRHALVGALSLSLLATSGAAPASAETLADQGVRSLADLEVIGHRAAPHWGPENTLAALKHAIAVGADAVELDILFTKDNRPIIFHDLLLDRTTNCTGLVKERTWKQLKKCDAGSWFDPVFAGERIPKLSTTLRKISRGSDDLRFYLHVKQVDNAKQARKIVKLLRKYDMRNKRSIAFSDKTSILERLDKADFKRKYLGLIFNAKVDGWSEQYRKYKTLVPYNRPITAKLVAQAHRRGQKVIAVESSLVSLDALRDVGLDGFMANALDDTLTGLGRLAAPSLADKQATARAKSAGKQPAVDLPGVRADNPPEVPDDPSGS